jgi:hypothetical protein
MREREREGERERKREREWRSTFFINRGPLGDAPSLFFARH